MAKKSTNVDARFVFRGQPVDEEDMLHRDDAAELIGVKANNITNLGQKNPTLAEGKRVDVYPGSNFRRVMWARPALEAWLEEQRANEGAGRRTRRTGLKRYALQDQITPDQKESIDSHLATLGLRPLGPVWDREAAKARRALREGNSTNNGSDNGIEEPVSSDVAPEFVSA